MSAAIPVDRSNFEQVVIEGSASKPVLVDFWAPWCAPCRSLAPILDKLATEFADRFTLAKLNTDDEQALAAEFGIRGIPDCKLFVAGKVVDQFTGALPERALRDWLANALPSPAARLVASAQGRLAARDAIGAIADLDQAFALDPGDEDAALTRIEALLALDRCAEACAVVAELERPERERSRPVRDARRLATLKARAALASGAGADLEALARKAAAAPADCAARLAYAQALAAAGDHERALAEMLAVVRTDRAFGDDAARKAMLTVFEALGSDSDLVRRYRRELASALNR